MASSSAAVAGRMVGFDSMAVCYHFFMRGLKSLLILGIVAWAVPAVAQTPACTPPLQPMLRAEMYFGRNTHNRQIVNDRAWARFVAHELAPHFPEGLTVVDGWGHWRHGDSSVVSREHSKVVIIVTPDIGQVRARLAAMAEVYKQHFEQQSVGIVVQPVCAVF
jgi:hypothetical protein